MSLSRFDAKAELERADIRSRTKAALAVIRARGQKTGGSVPYGFRLEADGRALVAVEGEQSVIARARTLAAEGRSLRAAAAQLAAEGHVSRKGVPFFAAQIGRMLASVKAQRAA
jgi:DNA invertase Pin-like site-specific DNA recombinase